MLLWVRYWPDAAASLFLPVKNCLPVLAELRDCTKSLLACIVLLRVSTSHRISPRALPIWPRAFVKSLPLYPINQP
ncbi:hypothetical protein SBC1_13990 [Caballeronia sp. SBC1]|nr:hypothetical protein SBC2_15380 [Caballeronia sp. SBC2]QIN61409.1 hypothetical protein SBC1_13990 [Caballeronia sp. SBC1]